MHATAEQEYLDIRKAGFKQPVCVVPNGVDIPEQLPLHLTGENKNDEGVKEVLFLGRLHPPISAKTNWPPKTAIFGNFRGANT